MLVELTDEETTCSICRSKFSCDTGNTDYEIRKHLPVLSSSRCDHWFCHGCILSVQLRVAEDNNGKVPKWLRCMTCREKTSFRPDEPKYHRLLIDQLRRAQQFAALAIKREVQADSATQVSSETNEIEEARSSKDSKNFEALQPPSIPHVNMKPEEELPLANPNNPVKFEEPETIVENPSESNGKYESTEETNWKDRIGTVSEHTQLQKRTRVQKESCHKRIKVESLEEGEFRSRNSPASSLDRSQKRNMIQDLDKTGIVNGKAKEGGKTKHALYSVLVYKGVKITEEIRTEITRVRIGPQVKDIPSGT
ncbi:hypothetical protein THAOC_19241, partial [Thalassiosira oceanica]